MTYVHSVPVDSQSAHAAAVHERDKVIEDGESSPIAPKVAFAPSARDAGAHLRLDRLQASQAREALIRTDMVQCETLNAVL